MSSPTSTYPYNAAYRPAAPVCQVFLGASGRAATYGPLEALIDTGADITVVPMAYRRRVNAQVVARGRARGPWGDATTVNLYAVALRLDDLHFRALEVIGVEEGEELILGRFVLNRLRLVLDGPAATVDLFARSA